MGSMKPEDIAGVDKKTLLEVINHTKEWLRQMAACQHIEAPKFRDGDFMITLCTKCNVVMCAEEI